MTDIPEDAIHETWESVYAKSLQLAKLIDTGCQGSGERFDAIVVIPRGSYYPVNIIARELNFGATELLHAAVSSYVSGTTDRQTKFKLGQMPSDEEVKGKHLLIIDEVCDTGYTLQFLTTWLKKKGAELVRIGVLHYKSGQSQTGLKPDWFVAETDDWIVYPWEEREAEPTTAQVKRRQSN